MNKSKFILLFFLIACLLTNTGWAERVISTHYFNNLAIVETDNHDEGPPSRLEKKVIIHKTTPPTLADINLARKNSMPPQPKIAEIIWTITPKMLPANEKTCIKENIDPCQEITVVSNPYAGCFNSCIQYGPTFLAYDDKNQLLYLLAPTIEVGCGGGPQLGFVADLKNKTIKYLKVFDGFMDGHLSPDGKRILLQGRNFLGIYDITTNQEKSLEDLPVRNIEWLNNNQYRYQIKDGKDKNGYRTVMRNI